MMKLSRALRIRSGDVLALVGGGGKTTAMFRLANELAPEMRVLTTTSTRIFAAQINQSPGYVTFDPARQEVTSLLPRLEAALGRHGQVLLIGQADSASGKAFGLPPEVIDTLAASGRFDLIINEADGSRMRPFKAPAEHEPVIPASTSLVAPVVGMDVIGQPLEEATVHRAALVSRLSGTPLGQPVSVDTVAAVLRHPEGGLKRAPAGARVTPLLNKAIPRAGAAESRLEMAHDLAGRLLGCQRIDSVAIGAVQNNDRPVAAVRGRIAAVVLAAGSSSRFGSPKQLARWGDKTLIEQVVDVALASGARPVIVVLGAEVTGSQAALGRRPVKVVLNDQWAEGQSTSMKAGLAAAPANVHGVIFLLVDLPGVEPDVIEALIRRHSQTLAPLVWPEFEGRRGNPVIFDRSLFPELEQVTGDTGGRPLVMAYQDQAERVAVSDPAILQDIDRPEDLA